LLALPALTLLCVFELLESAHAAINRVNVMNNTKQAVVPIFLVIGLLLSSAGSILLRSRKPRTRLIAGVAIPQVAKRHLSQPFAKRSQGCRMTTLGAVAANLAAGS